MFNYDAQGIDATHEDFNKWIWWYITDLRRAGAPKQAVDHLAKQLQHFFMSGPIFLQQQSHLTCPTCKGSGISSLANGSGGGISCPDCGGLGLVPPSKTQ